MVERLPNVFCFLFFGLFSFFFLFISAIIQLSVKPNAPFLEDSIKHETLEEPSSGGKNALPDSGSDPQ